MGNRHERKEHPLSVVPESAQLIYLLVKFGKWRCRKVQSSEIYSREELLIGEVPFAGPSKALNVTEIL
jgi:hypothetical protein